MTYKNYRRVWFLLTIAYFSVGYLLLNWINADRSYYFNVGLPFEQSIPFIPYFIFGYTLDYLSVIVIYFLVTEEDHFKRMIHSYLLLTTVHFFFFILLPVKMEIRPVLPETTGIVGEIIKFLFWLDKPQNCFPSLHVAYMVLGTLVLWNYKRTWSYIYLISMIIVSISVVLVKQHYIFDVLGGYITAPIVFWICFGKKPKELKSGS